MCSWRPHSLSFGKGLLNSLFIFFLRHQFPRSPLIFFFFLPNWVKIHWSPAASSSYSKLHHYFHFVGSALSLFLSPALSFSGSPLQQSPEKMSNFCRQIKLSSSLIRRLKHRSSNSMLSGRRSFTTTEGHRPSLVHKRSLDILHDPWFNKVILLSMHFNFVPFCLICSLVVVEKSCDRYQLDSWFAHSFWWFWIVDYNLETWMLRDWLFVIALKALLMVATWRYTNLGVVLFIDLVWSRSVFYLKILVLVGACWSAPRGLGSHGEFEGLGMEGSSITQKKIKFLRMVISYVVKSVAVLCLL